MLQRKSKYLNKKFGNWLCTDVCIASVQTMKAKYPGHRSYFYVFERRTSDSKADKIICLNSTEASKVYKGVKCVEEILNRRVKVKPKKFTRQVNYCFD